MGPGEDGEMASATACGFWDFEKNLADNKRGWFKEC